MKPNRIEIIAPGLYVPGGGELLLDWCVVCTATPCASRAADRIIAPVLAPVLQSGTCQAGVNSCQIGVLSAPLLRARAVLWVLRYEHKSCAEGGLFPGFLEAFEDRR